jgi:hypothetical protein
MRSAEGETDLVAGVDRITHIHAASHRLQGLSLSPKNRGDAAARDTASRLSSVERLVAVTALRARVTFGTTAARGVLLPGAQALQTSACASTRGTHSELSGRRSIHRKQYMRNNRRATRHRSRHSPDASGKMASSRRLTDRPASSRNLPTSAASFTGDQRFRPAP